MFINNSQKEFERLVKVCSAEDVKLPTKRELEKKIAEIKKLEHQPMTEVIVLLSPLELIFIRIL